MVDEHESVQLSVIIAVRDPKRALPMQQLYHDYKQQIDKTDLKSEFIFIIEGDHPNVINSLKALKKQGERIKIIVFAKWYGDATVLSAGFNHAEAPLLLTLPAYHQIRPDVLPSVITSLNSSDMLVVRRWPRIDGNITGFQVRVFHLVLQKLLGFDFKDLGCSVRLFKKKVVESVQIYGDQHRFYPVLVSHYGFKVKEIEAQQAESDTFQNHISMRTYLNRLLDLLSVFFLSKFTKKPLRFFGFGGFIVFGIGSLLTVYLTAQRLFFGVSLADKPVLLLGILGIVLGTLLFAIGLIGEMIIFTHARNLKEYNIERII